MSLGCSHGFIRKSIKPEAQSRNSQSTHMSDWIYAASAASTADVITGVHSRAVIILHLCFANIVFIISSTPKLINVIKLRKISCRTPHTEVERFWYGVFFYCLWLLVSFILVKAFRNHRLYDESLRDARLH